ncbi:MAG: ASCH domain-containing protein [Candidatus Spechtbacterales bacterium]|nr:ASCH domain-containing protein [Candidatus Spechtbacterales bacterium]
MPSALIIDEPWISKILSGQKNWEIRTQTTHKRGEIGLIRKGSGLIVGSVEIVNVLELPRNISVLHDTFQNHNCWAMDLINYGDPEKPLYAWVLKDANRFEDPIPYDHPRGAVIWVKVPDWKKQKAEV